MSTAPEGNELYLLDGSSLAYRAFFALPESIATSTGQPTNAIFGFASMLVKLMTEFGQKPTIVVWDAGHSGRKEISPDYKATRQSRPDLLKEQWPHLMPLVEAFGYRNIAVDGYEADDVIASIAEKARTADPPVPVVVVTGDRDIFQLIDPESHVRVLATGRGKLRENNKRVIGVGMKKDEPALLAKIADTVDEISGAKRKENLTNHAEDARISKQLATIQRDVPVDVDPRAELEQVPDRTKLREVFRAWRPSLVAGAAGAGASQLWLLAFALQTAAAVRTVGLIEILFSMIVSRRVFAQRMSVREVVGVSMMVAGVIVLLAQTA